MNTSLLQQFLQGDGAWLITAIAVILGLEAWRNSSWIQLFSVIGFWGVIISMTKGQQILSVIGWALRLIGIETGL
ncbi:hypothetical protein [Streptococcus dentiloxodontae]